MNTVAKISRSTPPITMGDGDYATLNDITRLSEEALQETDVDKVIERLKEKNAFVMSLPLNESSLSVEEMERCLQTELAVLSRLEEERKKLLKQMEELSRYRKACQTYEPKFPFPPIPAFLDTTT